MPYLACSAESEEGFCPNVDTSCSAVNTCRTCGGFSDSGGDCVELDYFPNCTVAEYGEIGAGDPTPTDYTTRAQQIKAEIYLRVSLSACISYLLANNPIIAFPHSH